jgi:thioredoxin reductase (NADPH)
MQDRAFANSRISFVWDSVVDEIYGDRQSGVKGVRFKNVTNDKTTDFRTDGVFMAIGHQPNTAIFQGQLEMDELGYLKVKPGSTYTNVAGVFAAGDVADKVYRQAVTAAGTGCMAALDAERWLEARHG